MTLSTSPSPSEPSLSNQQLSENLDAEIDRIRAEIQSLTKRKQLLTSSLLSSTKVQSYLSRRTTSQYGLPTDLTPLHAQAQHNETNVHRLAYGVTSFPFTDPNPDTSDRPLLGIRFDIPSRSGRFEKAPYYIFLKRTDEETDSEHETADSDNLTKMNSHILKIHHHTIPALVPLQDYEDKYLPQTILNTAQPKQRRDEGYFSPSPTNDVDGMNDTNNSTTSDDEHTIAHPAQDLHGLIAAVRRDLTSWHLRTDAISLLAEQLNVSDSNATQSNEVYRDDNVGRFLLQSLEATSTDARFCRLVWRNGTVGRLRLTDDGHIDRAVVIGEVGDEQRSDRLKDVERILSTGRGGRRLEIMQLPERLEEVARLITHKASLQVGDGGRPDSMELDGSGQSE